MLYSILKKKIKTRAQRKKRIRKKISGTESLPRLSIFKSNRYFYAQAINDTAGHTLSSIDGHALKLKSNKIDVKTLAEQFSKNLKSKNIKEVIFDRNGYLYHGVVKVFADTLRESGIKI